jgi:hypothetical protein
MSTLRKACALVAVLVTLTSAPQVWAQMKMGTMPADAPVMPAVTGYSEGQVILFLHTATSDPAIAKILTDMMGSPVLVVPSLAEVPNKLLAQVYVFTNGLTPEGARGPLGFQPDIFDSPPGLPGYTPLRRIVLVTWKDGSSARLLKSAAEVEAILNTGDVTAERPGIVVNMPMLTWPSGRR